MALYTKAELLTRLGGRLTSITDDEYNAAVFYSDNTIKPFTRMRYEDPDDSSSEVFKNLALEIGAWFVFDFHFNEQQTDDTRKMWTRYENALLMLDRLSKGELTSDADSVESTRKDVVVGVYLNADDEAESKFREGVTEYW